MWTAQYYRQERKNGFLTSGGLGAMGYGVPTAIGASFARPDDEVWVIVGDGGFQMSIPELATIMQEHRDQDRGDAQRVPRHGAPVAGVDPRQALLGSRYQADPIC